MYIKHLWRRREQIRSQRFDLVIEDESFATWFARDLSRCPDLQPWLEANIELFYPRRLGGCHGEYRLVLVEISEELRAQRLHSRRLERGAEYAAAEYARHGTFADRLPAVEFMTDLLCRHALVRGPEKPEFQLAMLNELKGATASTQTD